MKFHVLLISFLLSIGFGVLTVRAQDTVKQSVVRIENPKLRETGAGFIVKIVGDKGYVVTAAHVVRGEQKPLVYLFSEQTRSVSASVIDREEDDLKGLALLVFTANARTLAGILEFKLSATADLGHGEAVTFIGFPGTSLWTVDGGNVKRLEGRNLVLSGFVRQGNSGGPIVLNQQAIGLVTDVSQSDVYAARAETVVVYVNGLISKLIKLADTEQPATDDFCEGLKTLVQASNDGFYSVIGEPTGTKDLFYSKVRLVGSETGYIKPRKEAYYFWLTDKNESKVESAFYQGVVKIKRCLQGWKEEEQGTSHKFIEPNGSVLVDLNYLTQNSESYLLINIYP